MRRQEHAGSASGAAVEASGLSDRVLAAVQMWLLGWPSKRSGGKLRRRPWTLVRLGNLISDVRYWTWRARGGKFTDEMAAATTEALVELCSFTSTNQSGFYLSGSTTTPEAPPA